MRSRLSWAAASRTDMPAARAISSIDTPRPVTARLGTLAWMDYQISYRLERE